MKKIKNIYTKPRPMLYLYRGMPETSLVSRNFNSAKNITLNCQMNEVSTLSFEIPFTIDRKISVDDCEKLVKFEGEYYIIKTINTEDAEVSNMKISCQHESSELKGVYCEYIELIGASPKEMFDKIMSSTMHPVDTGYKWAGTDVDETKKRHLITSSEQSVYQNLVEMAEVFNGWLEFYTDENEVKWIFLRTKSIDSGKWIKKGLDMKSLNITYSSDEIFTRLYPTGASDTLTGEPLNIMEVNPTGKSYIENYSYYIAKGIPTSIIDKEPKYQQLKTMNCSDYTDAKDLYEYSLEELEKCCYPQLDATLTMKDLSIYVDSLDDPPMIGYDIKCVDKEIDFILGCRITGVERDYNDPLETKITISNLVRYDTFFQKIEHSSTVTDKVTDSDSDGNYIPADKVKDGDHINIAYTLGDHTTKITETGKKIELLAEDVEGNKATLTLQSEKIETLVKDVSGNSSKIEQNAQSITSTVKRVGEAESKIKQNADEISLKVSSGRDFTSEMKQNSSAFKFLFSDVTADIMTIDSEGILIENSDGSYTRIGSKGIENLSSETSSNGKPYHYLQYTDSSTFSSSGTDDYEHDTVSLPTMFNKMDSSNISVSVSVQKVYKNGYYLPYWFGCYGEVTGSKGSRKTLHLYHMSCWRKVYMDDTDSWVEDIGGKYSGGIIVRYTIIA